MSQIAWCGRRLSSPQLGVTCQCVCVGGGGGGGEDTDVVHWYTFPIGGLILFEDFVLLLLFCLLFIVAVVSVGFVFWMF